MKPGLNSRLKVSLALGTGALLALMLCVQCVRTYWYIDNVLVPQQAQREAERQAAALGTAARSAGVSDPRSLGPVIEHLLASGSDRVLWMRVSDPDGNVLAQGGKPGPTAKVPLDWRGRLEKHQNVASVAGTSQNRAF